MAYKEQNYCCERPSNGFFNVPVCTTVIYVSMYGTSGTVSFFPLRFYSSQKQRFDIEDLSIYHYAHGSDTSSTWWCYVEIRTLGLVQSSQTHKTKIKQKKSRKYWMPLGSNNPVSVRKTNVKIFSWNSLTMTRNFFIFVLLSNFIFLP